MKLKKYSVAYWIKTKLQFQSRPEELIADAVRRYATDAAACELAFEGSPLELLNALYLEHKKRSTVYWGLFPTPLDVADDLVRFAEVTADDVVFDPGCGLGNLLHAAERVGARGFGVEAQPWIPPLGDVLNLEIARGDYLDGYAPPAFTCVLTNPPFGKQGEVSCAVTGWLERLAQQCDETTRIAAILPAGFMDKERPLATKVALQRFIELDRQPLPAGTFKPLTGAATEMVRLQCSRPLKRPGAAVEPAPVSKSPFADLPLFA